MIYKRPINFDLNMLEDAPVSSVSKQCLIPIASHFPLCAKKNVAARFATSLV